MSKLARLEAELAELKKAIGLNPRYHTGPCISFSNRPATSYRPASGCISIIKNNAKCWNLKVEENVLCFEANNNYAPNGSTYYEMESQKFDEFSLADGRYFLFWKCEVQEVDDEGLTSIVYDQEKQLCITDDTDEIELRDNCLAVFEIADEGIKSCYDLSNCKIQCFSLLEETEEIAGPWDLLCDESTGLITINPSSTFDITGCKPSGYEPVFNSGGSTTPISQGATFTPQVNAGTYWLYACVERDKFCCVTSVEIFAATTAGLGAIPSDTPTVADQLGGTGTGNSGKCYYGLRPYTVDANGEVVKNSSNLAGPFPHERRFVVDKCCPPPDITSDETDNRTYECPLMFPIIG